MFQRVHISNVKQSALSRMSDENVSRLLSVSQPIQSAIHSLCIQNILDYSVNHLWNVEYYMNILNFHFRYINSLYYHFSSLLAHFQHTLVHFLPFKCNKLLLVFQLKKSQKQQGFQYQPILLLEMLLFSDDTHQNYGIWFDTNNTNFWRQTADLDTLLSSITIHGQNDLSGFASFFFKLDTVIWAMLG